MLDLSDDLYNITVDGLRKQQDKSELYMWLGGCVCQAHSDDVTSQID